MRDFTMGIFRDLCKAFMHAEYEFITFSDYCNNARPATFVVFRHDVDAGPQYALRMAQCEREMGIRSSYYFRVVKQSFDETVIKKIAEMDHEIGYHYEDLALAKGNFDLAIASFENNLKKLRRLHPVRTICMHGSPLSQWDNRSIWERYDYSDFGIIGEPYLDTNFSEISYYTDTGRTWDGADHSVRDRVNINLGSKFAGTYDIIKAISNNQISHKLMFTIHPQRWHDELIPWLSELIRQSCKNVVKKHILVKQ